MNPRLIAGCAIAAFGCIGSHYLPFVGGNYPPTAARYIVKCTTGVLSILAGVAAIDPQAAKTATVVAFSAGAATVGAYIGEHLMLAPLREAYRRGRKC